MVVKKSDITYIVASVFAAMTGLFYCSIRWFHIKLPRYYPLEHTWKMAKEKAVPSQAWYSMQIFTYLCAGVVALIIYLILKSISREKEITLKPALTKSIGVAVTVIMIYSMGYLLYYEFDKWGIF